MPSTPDPKLPVPTAATLTAPPRPRIGSLREGLLLLVVAGGLLLIGTDNYLLFHGLVEMFAVVVACAIFMVAWNAREFVRSPYFLFLGIAHLFVGILELLHTFAYRGMGVWPDAGTDLATQLWIAARGLEAVSLLAAFVFVRRQVPARTLLLVYTAVTALVLASIFAWDIFPTCFRDEGPDRGLTGFKVASEYAIVALLGGALLVLWRRRKAFSHPVRLWLGGSIGATMVAELLFTLYAGPTDAWNMAGHFLMLLSFYLIYKALIETALRNPYDLLFRELRQREADLRRQEERFRTFADFTRDWEYWVAPDRSFQYVAPSCRRVTGYEAEEFMRRPELLSEIVHPDDREAFDAHSFGSPPTPQPPARLRFRIRTRDGRERWIGHVCQPVSSPEGRYLGRRANNRDITEQKEFEDSLRQTALDLARSNRDLEQFAYVASHDLQEPLRMITGYLQLIQRRYEGQLDADADEFIRYAVDGARRMGELLSGLLAYSRVGTRGKDLSPTDANTVLENVRANLKRIITESGAEVTADPLPTVAADATQLVQLLQNLIGNALKFRRPDVTPKVHVSARQTDGRWEFCVADNGIGIESEYKDRTFVIFQRLHAREDYPGTGIGLALCKKIVERHGGEIRVESTPGAGSAFYFTLSGTEQ